MGKLPNAPTPDLKPRGCKLATTEWAHHVGVVERTGHHFVVMTLKTFGRLSAVYNFCGATNFVCNRPIERIYGIMRTNSRVLGLIWHKTMESLWTIFASLLLTKVRYLSGPTCCRTPECRLTFPTSWFLFLCPVMLEQCCLDLSVQITRHGLLCPEFKDMPYAKSTLVGRPI